MPEPNFGERILQRGDERWMIREVSAHRVPGARGPRCLICESPSVVRRLWDYPDDWQALNDHELLALCARESAA
ncbi:MAG TPA: hypothetical protein VH277_10525 [Gemmatimonadaceae bacterium]|jgi:hypothetical protein|nr:hypothetical protein [Gemmatimonadaceae bacterium]